MLYYKLGQDPTCFLPCFWYDKSQPSWPFCSTIINSLCNKKYKNSHFLKCFNFSLIRSLFQSLFFFSLKKSHLVLDSININPKGRNEVIGDFAFFSKCASANVMYFVAINTSKYHMEDKINLIMALNLELSDL